MLESAGGCFGLLVDSVGEVLTVSSADYEPNPSILDERRRALLAGAYKLKDTARHARSRAARSSGLTRRIERGPGCLKDARRLKRICKEETMRALIVDDSRFVRGYLRGLLEEKGIECEEAADGQAGLERLHAGPAFDLALVDWNMPVMNGLEMLSQCAPRASAI